MSEEAFQAIQERAKTELERMGKPNLLDMLHPTQPGMAVSCNTYDRFGLRLRLLCATTADTSFDFLGQKLATPLMIAPMSDNSLGNHYPEAYRALSEGARRAGAQYWIGDCTDETWKKVAEVTSSAIRIVKPWKDRERILTSLRLAEESGALAVGMDFESGFYNPECTPQSASDLTAFVKAASLPFIVKAVGSVDTARIARDAGAAGIIVTMHGGSLGPSWGHPLEILPDIVQEVGSDLLILASSGVRRGEDALKLLARGAKGVLMGRGVLPGLFAGGADGVTEILSLLNQDLKRVMVQAGCANLQEVGEEILIPR